MLGTTNLKVEKAAQDLLDLGVRHLLLLLGAASLKVGETV
jgi:hypothetical protein